MRELAASLGVSTVPILAELVASSENELEDIAADLATAPSCLGGRASTREGVVMRRAAGFPDSAFESSVAKYVSADFDVIGKHWSASEVLRHRDAANSDKK